MGVLLVLFLFTLLIWRGLNIGKTAHLQLQMFDAFIAYGLTFWLAMQVIVNVGVIVIALWLWLIVIVTMIIIVILIVVIMVVCVLCGCDCKCDCDSC